MSYISKVNKIRLKKTYLCSREKTDQTVLIQIGEFSDNSLFVYVKKYCLSTNPFKFVLLYIHLPISIMRQTSSKTYRC